MKRTVAAAVAFALLPCTGVAQTPQKPTLDAAVAAIEAFGPRALAGEGAPGMSVAITDRTHTIKILTFGYANLESKAPVTESTRFPIGSISKSFTVLALLQLHDRGLVDLNAPVRRYLPWWHIHGGDGVLVHQLLSHTGGIPDDYTFDGSYGYEVAMLRNAHTLFAPGTNWSYANDGTATVGAIEEAVSGKPWQNLIESSVFAPLGMTHSSPYFTTENMADAATGYIFAQSDVVATPPNPALIPAQRIDFLDPAGSVLSTPADMAAYMRLYLNGGKTADGTALIEPSSFQAMTNADRLNDGKPAGSSSVMLDEWPSFYRQYGYALAVFHTGGDHLIGHTGGISGYTACMQMNLTRGFGVIAMANLVEAPLHPCAIVKYAMEVLRAQSLGEPLPAAPAGPPIPAPVVVPSQYTGTYRTTSGTSVDVENANGTLQLRDAGSTYALDPRGGDLFWTNDPRFPIFYVAFGRNRAKQVDSFTVGSAFYANARYAGPMAFSYPRAWDALAGRYETAVWGTPAVTRIVIVKGKLTADGITPLKARSDGSFALGDSVLRFDTPAAGKMQRMWLDGGAMYRLNLP